MTGARPDGTDDVAVVSRNPNHTIHFVIIVTEK